MYLQLAYHQYSLHLLTALEAAELMTDATSSLTLEVIELYADMSCAES